jgi:hypothetical protein
MTVGFIALWKNNQREYSASPRDEWGTNDAIQAAFANGRDRGNRTYGLYYCRWSSPWQYLTFWVSPGMDAVVDTIADLERAGDFKFADSWHIFGRYRDEPTYLTDGAWGVIPEPVEGEPPLLGMVLLERWNGAAPDANPASTAIRTEAGGENTLRFYGAFDCRFSTGWDRFSFVTAADANQLAIYLRQRERAGGFRGVDSLAVTGRLDRYFRFGNHLQTSLTWLDVEAEQR